MKIYTKTGDKGKTSLFGGKRVWKDNNRIKACGSVDELNSVLGITISQLYNTELKEVLCGIQNLLFNVGADLAAPLNNRKSKIIIPRISEADTKRFEELIDNYEAQLQPLKNFILPGGSKGAAYLHNARSVCRRAEREVITVSKKEMINNEIIIFLNRLSDLLFVLARFENYSSSHSEVEWKK
jgi:cob(I)alamin adenosyltransferase